MRMKTDLTRRTGRRRTAAVLAMLLGIGTALGQENGLGYFTNQAVILWGFPAFTTNDSYVGPGPAWFLGAGKDGGAWVSNSWQVGADEPTNSGWLYVDLDRSQMTNRDAVLEVELLDRAGSSLFLDLVNATDQAVAVGEDLYGNIMAEEEAVVRVRMDLPLSVYQDAVTLRLRRGEGAVTVYQTIVSLSSSVVSVISGGASSGGEGTGSVSGEALSEGGTTGVLVGSEASAQGAGSEGGGQDAGGTNSSVAGVASNGVIRTVLKGHGVIYVDARHGNDGWQGIEIESQAPNGPKRTLAAGTEAARNSGGRRVAVKAGTYRENLDISGQDVSVVIEGSVTLGYVGQASEAAMLPAVSSNGVAIPPVSTNR